MHCSTLLHGFPSGVASKLKVNLAPLKVIHISNENECDYNVFKLFEKNYPSESSKNKGQSSLFQYAEPFFQHFQEIYSRHWYPRKISRNEYKKSFFYYISFFNNLYLANEIQFVIFSNIPHEGPDYISYIIAKYFKIRILVFYQSLFNERCFFSDDLYIFKDDNLNQYNSLLTNYNDKEINLCVENTISSIGDWFYMKQVEKFKKNRFINTLKLTFPKSRNRIRYLLKIAYDCYRYSKKINSLEIKHVNLNQKYVYFPLHLQPELTTSALGFDYIDSNDIIETLESLIPNDYLIYVKENPKQTPFKRPQSFLNRLSGFKKVRLVPIGFSSLELIEHSSLVITNTGTVGWEAINLNKKILTFGTTWYRKLPGVISYRNGMTWDEIINTPAHFNLVKNETKTLLKQKTLKAVVDLSYSHKVKNFSANDNDFKIADFATKFYALNN